MNMKLRKSIGLLLIVITLLSLFSGCVMMTGFVPPKNEFVSGQDAKDMIGNNTPETEIKDLAKGESAVTPLKSSVKVVSVKKTDKDFGFNFVCIFCILLSLAGIGIALGSIDSKNKGGLLMIIFAFALFILAIMPSSFTVHRGLFLASEAIDSKNVCLEFIYDSNDTQSSNVMDLVTSAYAEADGEVYETRLYLKTFPIGVCDPYGGMILPGTKARIIIKTDIPKDLLKAGTQVTFVYTVDGGTYRTTYKK